MSRIQSAVLVISFLVLTLLGCSQPSSAESGSVEGAKQAPDAGAPAVVADETGTVQDVGFWQPPEVRAPRFLFVHHSTGSGFMFNGGMVELLEEAGFEVHSRTYGDGWVGDNTNPDHFPVTFTEHFDDLVSWDLPEGQQYDIIAFKSCYPASNICTDEKLEQYKEYYATIKTVTREHPEILFIPWSTPPLVPAATEPDCAARADEFALWLTGEYTVGETNLAAYDVFHVLAGTGTMRDDYNCLMTDYQNSPDNSHPNHEGNLRVAGDFTEWLTLIVWGN